MKRPGWWRTDIVVGVVVGTPLMYLAFLLTGWKWGTLLTALLAYESWTILNRIKNDTISESLWRLSERPFIPWLFGVATGFGIASGVVSNSWLVLSVGFLGGHFFFQRHEAKEEKTRRRRRRKARAKLIEAVKMGTEV